MTDRVHRERYPALVSDVNDPEQRGRILVECQSLLAKGEVYPFWAEPAFPYAGKGYGFFFLPQVGDIVELEIIEGCDSDPIPGSTGMYAPEPRWRCCDYADTPYVPEEFRKKGSYGRRMGIKMPSGQHLMFDEDTTAVVLRYGKLYLGSEGASENLVLGQVFKTMMSAFLALYAAHTHENWAGVTTVPNNATSALALKTSPVDDEAMLSDVAFCEKTSL